MHTPLASYVSELSRNGSEGQAETLVTSMYQRGFQEFRFGYAAAISWALFLVIMVFAIFELRVFRDDDLD